MLLFHSAKYQTSRIPLTKIPAFQKAALYFQQSFLGALFAISLLFLLPTVAHPVFPSAIFPELYQEDLPQD